MANQNDDLYDDLSFQREVCMLWTPKHGTIDISTNDSPGAVDFDFEAAHREIIQNNIRPNILYMIHSHPNFLRRMSSIDESMLHGWVLGFGLPIMFLIVVEDAIVYNLAFKDKETKKVIQLELFKVPRKHIHIPECQILIDVIYGLSKLNDCPSKSDLDLITRQFNVSSFDLHKGHIPLIESIFDDNLLLSSGNTAHICNLPQIYSRQKITFASPIS